MIQPLLQRFGDGSGLTVNARYAGTSELTATLLEEGPGTPADLFISQDAAALGALSAAGLLRPLPDDVLELVPPRFRSGNGDWVGLALQAGQRRFGRMWNMMSIAMDCASGMSDDWAERIAKEAETTLLADAINFPYPEVCEGVPIPDLGDEFREAGKSDVPILFISGTVDGRTPPSNAERILPGFLEQ